MNTPKVKAIAYVDRGYLSYFQEGAGGIITLSFPATVIRDLEVISAEELDKQIKTFIDANKLAPSNIIMVLSDNTLFTKDFPLTQENLPDITQEFLDTIPFENTTSKTYKLEKINRVVAVNADLHSFLKDSFEKCGFIIEFIVPAFMTHGVNFASGINPQAGKLLFSQSSSLKQANLLEMQIIQETIQKDELKDFMHKSKNRRAVLLLGVFGVLILVLFIVAYLTFFVKPAPTPKQQPIPTIQTTPTSAPVFLESQPASTSAEEAEELTAQILNGSGVTGQAQIVKTELEKIGIVNILTGNSTATSPVTLVIFKESVDTIARTKIITSLQTIFESVSSQENNESQYDVQITTGKPLTTPTPLPQ